MLDFYLYNTGALQPLGREYFLPSTTLNRPCLSGIAISPGLKCAGRFRFCLKDLTHEMDDYTTILKQADIFHGFTSTQVELVANLCWERNFKQGEIIFRESSDSDELYIIAHGEVEILINPEPAPEQAQADREPILIATLREGQSFGEIALVDRGVRSATARAARNNTHLLVIPSKKLMLLCNTYPYLGYRLMHNLAADLSLKIRSTDLRIREVLYYRPRQA